MHQRKQKCPLALSILSAVCAVAAIAFYFLPIYYVHNVFRLLTAEFVNIWVMMFKVEAAHTFFYKIFPFIMYGSIALLAVWAILSLIRLKAAGVIGLIASIFQALIGAAWFYYALVNASQLASYNFRMTPVPYLMPVLGIVGIVLSIIQIKKSK